MSDNLLNRLKKLENVVSKRDLKDFFEMIFYQEPNEDVNIHLSEINSRFGTDFNENNFQKYFFCLNVDESKCWIPKELSGDPIILYIANGCNIEDTLNDLRGIN